jgi:hypothetical protein
MDGRLKFELRTNEREVKLRMNEREVKLRRMKERLN